MYMTILNETSIFYARVPSPILKASKTMIQMPKNLGMMLLEMLEMMKLIYQERERRCPARFTFKDLQRSEQSVGPTNILLAESSARLFLFVSR